MTPTPIAMYVNADSELEASIAPIFIVSIRLARQENARCHPLSNVPFVNDVTNQSAVATTMSKRSIIQYRCYSHG